MAEELGTNRERISLKIDTETNWNNSAVTFIPYNGELLIYRNSTTDQPRLKVGDGATLPKNLPFFRDETGGGGGGGSSSITTVNVTPGRGSISADGTTLTININSGSTSSAGVVQLKNSIGNNESSTTTAATPKAVWDALQNYSYTLPLAANGTRGGIQIGFTTSAANRNYAVQLSNEKAYVNVPWTDTNTTYTFATGDSAGQFKVTPSSGNAYNVNVKNVLVTDINNVNKIYVAAPSGTNNTCYPGIMGYRQGATANTDSTWLVEGIVNDTSVRTAFAQKIKDSNNTAYEVFNLPPTTATFSSNSNQYIYTTKNVKAGSNISITRNGYDLTIAATGLTSGTVTSVRVQATSPVVSSVNTAQTTTLNTTISLADGYGDTKNPYASKTKNYVLAAPAAANGVPSFRALVEDDLIHLYANSLKMTINGANNFYGFVPPASDVASSQTYPRAWIYCKYGSGTNGSQIGFGHRYVNNTPAATIHYEFPPITAAIDTAATYRIWTTREYNLDYTTSGKNYKVTKDINGGLYVNVPWTNTITTVTTTGDGNAVTAISGSNGAITATKGNSFLPLSGGTMTGRLVVPEFRVNNPNGMPSIVMMNNGQVMASIGVLNSKRIAISQYGNNASHYEVFMLPATNDDLTSNPYYNLLTDKNTVTVAQGGTSATTAAGARTNLDVICKTSDTNVGPLVSTIRSSNWWNGRDNSFIRKRVNSGQYGVLSSIDTSEGTWEIGTYCNSNNMLLRRNSLYFNFVANGLYNTTHTASSDPNNHVNAQIRFFPPSSEATGIDDLADYNTATGRIYANLTAPDAFIQYLYVMPYKDSSTTGINHAAAVAFGYSGGNELIDKQTSGVAEAMVGWDHENKRLFLCQYDTLHHATASTPGKEYYYLPQVASITTDQQYYLYTNKQMRFSSAIISSIPAGSSTHVITLSSPLPSAAYHVILTLYSNATRVIRDVKIAAAINTVTPTGSSTSRNAKTTTSFCVNCYNAGSTAYSNVYITYLVCLDSLA